MNKSKAQRRVRIFGSVRFICACKGIWTTAGPDAGYTLLHRTDKNRWELWSKASNGLINHGVTMKDAARGLR